MIQRMKTVAAWWLVLTPITACSAATAVNNSPNSEGFERYQPSHSEQNHSQVDRTQANGSQVNRSQSSASSQTQSIERSSAKRSLKSCAKLLPPGHRYNVTISLLIDSTVPYRTEANGEIKVNAVGISERDPNLTPFMDCVRPFIR